MSIDLPALAQWPGRALHGSLPRGRSECTLQLEGQRLLAVLPDGATLEVDLTKARLRRQGVQGQELVLQERGDGPVLCCEDPTLAVILAQVPEIRAQLGSDAAKRKKDRLVRWVVAPLVLGALGATALWLLTGPAVSLVLAVLPESIDAQVGQAAHDSTVRAIGADPKRPVDDPALKQALATITARLADGNPQGPKLSVQVYRSDIVNAFALPGGGIVLTTALLQAVGSPEEVAAVLAHEHAHVTRRHGLRQLIRHVGIWLAAAAVVGDVSWMAAIVVDGSAAMVGLGFSRGMEAEADADAVVHLHSAGLEPAALGRALAAIEKASAAQQADGDEADTAMPAFLSTHPAPEERAEALAERVAELGKVRLRPMAVDWVAVRAGLGNEVQPARVGVEQGAAVTPETSP